MMKLPSLLILTSLLFYSAFVSVAALKSRKSSRYNDSIFCARLCRLQKVHLRLPCDVNECQLQRRDKKTQHQIFLAVRPQDDSVSDRQTLSRLAKAEKRVKEVWEGPAPADINH